MSGIVGISEHAVAAEQRRQVSAKAGAETPAVGTCASLTPRAQAKRCATPGPSGGAKRSIRAPSVCQASRPSR